ncbi:hypothetical protein OS493_002306 [Desmophyllum pertusum]|uniref:USP domain-containing protein n=1 Tax=Desmophyllum pertusum TaxID=174260 RepID=A0A9W9YVH4_9CNID|nr:hypothetical protein OS493_002306 [Desmophyllum pertusum]
MMTKPDSRLEQLSKYWKTNHADHTRCSQCKRAVMMWIRWQCKICKNYFCFECYNAELCGIVRHGNAHADVHQATFEKGYLPYKREDSPRKSENRGQTKRGASPFSSTQGTPIRGNVRPSEVRLAAVGLTWLPVVCEKWDLSVRGAVQLQSPGGNRSTTRTVGGPCTCHRSKPCNSSKCRCRQAGTPCTDECKCSQHICFFEQELGKNVDDMISKDSPFERKPRELFRGHGFTNVGSNCYMNCVLSLLQYLSVIDQLRKSRDTIPENCVVLRATNKLYSLASQGNLKNSEDYECSMAELLTAVEWDQGGRGVGVWNDPMEFLETLLEKMQEELENEPNIDEAITASFK